MQLGVCYYPEHWPQDTWEPDAKRMKEAGLTWVRIGEFAWSVIEPEAGRFEWAWLDRAVDTLAEAGLRVVLCTPTATPPRWLVDAMSDMLPVGRDGRVRGFGSRRHYDFAHEGYRDASAAIAAALAERYGRHEAVGAWQIDNEYGCHDTTRQAGPATRSAWRRWLAERYGSIEALNEAWWTTFWSMTYRGFDEVELPLGAVTDTAPGARLDYARFSSALVVEYHRRQAEEIRPRSPGRPITHNAMMFFSDIDATALGRELDAITWDSYPLGMLEQSPLSDALKARYARTGHPDLIAFNHDLYRCALDPGSTAPEHARSEDATADASGSGSVVGSSNEPPPFVPFWVMEQQPGPVNWAATNPLPAPGAVRLWTHQAFAHGAEVVSYFRWRAALGAQEHLHAGLLTHDRTPDQGLLEAETAARELTEGAAVGPRRRRAQVAVLFRYDDLWAGEIEPHAALWSGWGLWVQAYTALRALALDVDVIDPRRDLSGYRLIVAPSLTLADEALANHLSAPLASGATLLLGPRSGAYRPDMRVHQRAPGPLARLTGARVARADTLRPGTTGMIRFEQPWALALGGEEASYVTWADLLDPEPGTEVWARYATPAYAGRAALVCREHGPGRCLTVGASLDGPDWGRLLGQLAGEAGLPLLALPEGVRLSRSAGRPCLQNFTDAPVRVDLGPLGGGPVTVGPVDVAWVELPEG